MSQSLKLRVKEATCKRVYAAWFHTYMWVYEWNTEQKTIFLVGVILAFALGGDWLMNGMEYNACAAFSIGYG